MSKKYRVMQTADKTWQIYKLTEILGDELTYSRYPDHSDGGNVQIWTDEEAAEDEVKRLNAHTPFNKLEEYKQ
jgi:hypothetical protein